LNHGDTKTQRRIKDLTQRRKVPIVIGIAKTQNLCGFIFLASLREIKAEWNWYSTRVRRNCRSI